MKVARGFVRDQGMNGLEARYAAHLELRKRLGEIAWHAYQPLKLRLAKATYYDPDFLVMLADGTLEVHEVKGGWWRDDARAKTKISAALFPFRFYGVTERPKAEGGGWQYEKF